MLVLLCAHCSGHHFFMPTFASHNFGSACDFTLLLILFRVTYTTFLDILSCFLYSETITVSRSR